MRFAVLLSGAMIADAISPGLLRNIGTAATVGHFLLGLFGWVCLAADIFEWIARVRR